MNTQTNFGDVSAAAAPVLPVTAWTQAMGLLKETLPAHRTRPVLAGVVMRSSQPAHWSTFVVDIPDAATPAAATLGRHSACNQALPAGSLRQVVVLAWGNGGLWALDLNTGMGLKCGGAVATRLESKAGSLWFGAGGASVAAVVLHPGEDVSQKEQPVEALAVVSSDALATPVLGGVDVVGEHGPSTRTFVSYVGRLLCLSKAVGGWAHQNTMAVAAPDGTYRTVGGSMAHPGQWSQFQMDQRVLQRGVLIGRYERCASSRVIRCWDGVSRVHALLLHAFGRNYVVDLASSNGSSLQRGATCVPLTRSRPAASWINGTTLQLGRVLTVSLESSEAPPATVPAPAVVTPPSGTSKPVLNTASRGAKAAQRPSMAHVAPPSGSRRGGVGAGRPRCVGCGGPAILGDSVCLACSN